MTDRSTDGMADGSTDRPTGTTARSAAGSARVRPAPGSEPAAVYFPACVQTMFGPAVPGSPGTQHSFEQLCERVGIALFVPEGIDALCCGTPWASKGLTKGLATMSEKTLTALRRATRNGELPVICDASSCTEGLRHIIAGDTSATPITVMDAVEFAAARILPQLPDYEKIESLALHPTCSSTRMGANAALQAVADGVAERVEIPENWGCCAFAGDRGMLHPELTASATKAQAADVLAMDAAAFASCNRTCELGMTRATGKPYRHVLELLEELTRP